MADTTTIDTIESTAKEIKMEDITPFSGNKADFEQFELQMKIHLQFNKEIYDTDASKIGFTLSFMTGRYAATWKKQWIDAHSKQGQFGHFEFGTYADFQKMLKKEFTPYDAERDAFYALKRLRMEAGSSMDEHIRKFRILLGKSGLKDSLCIVDMFRETLIPAMQKKILFLDNPPTDIEGWYKWASKLDKINKMFLTIKHTPVKQKEVDILKKKGLCFCCKKHGHLARDCPYKGKGKEQEEKKKWSGKDLHTFVRKAMTEMEDKDKEEFISKLKEDGF